MALGGLTASAKALAVRRSFTRRRKAADSCGKGADPGLRTPDPGLWTLDSGPWTRDYKYTAFPMSPQPDVWLRGTIPGIAPVLQPAAHALIQAREDVESMASRLTADMLWTRVNGAASAGFHLRHMAGALDRLFTYARGEMLTDEQKAAARAESQDHPELDGPALVAGVARQIDRALAELEGIDPSTLLDERRVGRAGLPTTVIGALFHGAEHTARHAGQFITTVKIIG